MNPTTLDPTLFAGLLDGDDWIGPVEWSGNPEAGAPWRLGVWGPIGPSSGAPRYGVTALADNRFAAFRLNLNLNRREVRLRVADWMDQQGQSAEHLLDVVQPKPGRELTPAHSAMALVWSMEAMRRGHLVLAGVDTAPWVGWGRGGSRSANVLLSVPRRTVSAHGWRCSVNWGRPMPAGWQGDGPETGVAGQIAADVALSKLDWGYVNDGQLFLPELPEVTP